MATRSRVTQGDVRSATGGQVSLTRMIVIAALPFVAYTAVFIFGTARLSHSVEAKESETPGNLQTIALLRSVPNPDGVKHARGGGDTTIVGGVALLSESGPAGTLADIESSEHGGHISVYGVRKGDTLSQIADMFGVSVNTIRWANDISSGESIQPGDTLVILPITGVQHEVKKDDTLKSIAKKYGGDVDEIRQFNGLAADATIAVGDLLTIPNGEIAAPKPAPTPSAPSYTPAPAPSGPSYAADIRRPINGGYVSQGLHGYNGIDIATHYGAEIYAAASGQVIISNTGGWHGGYGNFVVVAHDDGTQTLYAHNSSNIVSAGQRVVQGQVIGYVGSTGNSTGAHLHFETRGFRNPFQ